MKACEGLQQNRDSGDFAAEFVPIEYYNSDCNELGIIVTDTKSQVLYERIIQKAYSIGGIRRRHYLFKTKRRSLLSGKDDSLTLEYLELCLKELECIES